MDKSDKNNEDLNKFEKMVKQMLKHLKENSDKGLGDLGAESLFFQTDTSSNEEMKVVSYKFIMDDDGNITRLSDDLKPLFGDTENVTTSLDELNYKLKRAVTEENYMEAAKLRDEISEITNKKEKEDIWKI